MKISVGIVGCGHWGKNLVGTFHELGALGAIVEVNPELRHKISIQYPKAQVFDSYETFLRTTEFAVAIATPATTHHPLCKQALIMKKDVFVEKPLTTSVLHAEDLARIAKANQRILMVGHLLLYQPAIRWLKSHIDSGKLGRIFEVIQERTNLGIVRNFEDVLWSFGTHDVAVLCYLLGHRPTRIQAEAHCINQPHIADNIYLHMKFSENIQTHLHVSWMSPERKRALSVIGSKGMLIYDELTQTVTLHQKTVDRDLKCHDEGCQVVFRGEPDPLRMELEHFLECIANRQQPLSDAAHGVEVVRILEKASQISHKEAAHAA